MTLVIQNGRIIDPSQKLDRITTMILRNGRVAEFTTGKSAPKEAQVINAEGCIVVPGLIDAHCHLRDPGQTGKEDITSGTAAAAAGGFTAVACMANTTPANDSPHITIYIIDRARTAGNARVYPIGAITRGLDGAQMSDMAAQKAAGIVAVSDDGMCVMNAQLMRRAMEYAATLDLPVIIHAEDSHMCTDTVMHEGRIATQLGLSGRPAESEEIIVNRDITLARLTGARLHVAHVSSAESVAAIARAKDEGIAITAEVTPHHLMLTDAALLNYNVNAKVNPPIRDERHRAALVKALRDGVIDMVATDHAPHTVLDKSGGMGCAACGMVGFETALGLILKLVADKKLSWAQVVERMSIAPAKLLGVPGGTLKKGCVADITLIDPRKKWRVDTAQFVSKSQNSPFDGWTLPGRARLTIVEGRVVFP